MNLATTIDLRFGGPGSGCKGDNCGRPRKSVADLMRERRGLDKVQIVDKPAEGQKGKLAEPDPHKPPSPGWKTQPKTGVTETKPLNKQQAKIAERQPLKGDWKRASGPTKQEEQQGKIFKGPKAKPLPETVAKPQGTPGLMKIPKGKIDQLKPLKQLKPTIKIKTEDVEIAKAPSEYKNIAKATGVSLNKVEVRPYDPKIDPQEFKNVTVKETISNPERFGKGLAKDSTQEMQQWLKSHPKQTAAPDQGLEGGDKVKIKQPVQTWVEHGGKGQLKTFPAGSEATVIKVTERVGNTPQTVTIKFKHSEMEQVLSTDVDLHRKGEINTRDKIPPEYRFRIAKDKKGVEFIEGPDPRNVKTSYMLKDGTRYTVLKPKGMPDTEGPGKGNYIREHSLKGRFQPTTPRVSGALYNQRTQWFFANKVGTPPGDDSGTIVRYEHQLTGKVHSIQEISTDKNGNWAMMRHYEFKNKGKVSGFLRASGFLNKRYGITQKMQESL